MSEPASLTPARERALMKAISGGFIMRAGGFQGDTSTMDVIAHPKFDRPSIVDRLIADGFLTFGEGFNQYSATDKGVAVIKARGERRRRRVVAEGAAA